MPSLSRPCEFCTRLPVVDRRTDAPSSLALAIGARATSRLVAKEWSSCTEGGDQPRDGGVAGARRGGKRDPLSALHHRVLLPPVPRVEYASPLSPRAPLLSPLLLPPPPPPPPPPHRRRRLQAEARRPLGDGRSPPSTTVAPSSPPPLPPACARFLFLPRRPTRTPRRPGTQRAARAPSARLWQLCVDVSSRQEAAHARRVILDWTIVRADCGLRPAIGRASPRPRDRRRRDGGGVVPLPHGVFRHPTATRRCPQGGAARRQGVGVRPRRVKREEAEGSRLISCLEKDSDLHKPSLEGKRTTKRPHAPSPPAFSRNPCSRQTKRPRRQHSSPPRPSSPPFASARLSFRLDPPVGTCPPRSSLTPSTPRTHPPPPPAGTGTPPIPPIPPPPPHPLLPWPPPPTRRATAPRPDAAAAAAGSAPWSP